MLLPQCWSFEIPSFNVTATNPASLSTGIWINNLGRAISIYKGKIWIGVDDNVCCDIGIELANVINGDVFYQNNEDHYMNQGTVDGNLGNIDVTPCGFLVNSGDILHLGLIVTGPYPLNGKITPGKVAAGALLYYTY